MEDPCFFRTLESGGAHDPWGRVWVLPRSVADLIALGTRRSSWRAFSESLNLHFARGFGFEVDDRSNEVEIADWEKGMLGIFGREESRGRLSRTCPISETHNRYYYFPRSATPKTTPFPGDCLGPPAATSKVRRLVPEPHHKRR